MPPLQKILIIRFSSIGDIVLTSPVIRACKQQAGAEVHFLTKRAFAPTVEHNPYIDRLWTIEKEVTEVLPGLREEGFTAILDLHNNLRSWRTTAALWPVRSYRFRKLNWRKWLLTRFKIDRLPAVHIVDRYLATGAALGLQNDGQGLDYFLAPQEEVSPGRRFAALQQGYVAFVTGAAHATKRLPEEQIIDICRRLPYPVALLGGPEEREQGERIASAAGKHVVNTCGQLRLNESASLVRQAAVVLTHDTGLMHIAAAFGRPIVSVWGNTVPAFGMYPYYPAGAADAGSVIEVEGLECRPCSKIGFAACPLGHFRCMREIDPALVSSVVAGHWK